MALPSFTQALATAASTGHWQQGMCDAFVAHCYGLPASGYQSAATHWSASSDKHPGDTAAPAGALVFWGGGSQGFGHVAISDGNGGIWSTDIGGVGTVTHVSLGTISSKWGLPYLGWATPQFGGSTSAVGPLGPNAGSATGGGTTGGSTAPGVLNPPANDDTCVLSLPVVGCIFHKSQMRALIGGALVGGAGVLFIAGIVTVLKYGLAVNAAAPLNRIASPVTKTIRKRAPGVSAAKPRPAVATSKPKTAMTAKPKRKPLSPPVSPTPAGEVLVP